MPGSCLPELGIRLSGQADMFGLREVQIDRHCVKNFVEDLAFQVSQV